MTTYTLKLDPIIKLTEDQFYQLCQENPDMKLERNYKGELVIMSPTGGGTGKRNVEVAADFVFWNRQAKLGVCFDSSTCFKLPNGGDRSPDVAWVKKERWDALTPEQQEKFPPIAPDFVLELMSPSDVLKDVQNKIQEYMDAGVKLGWLLDRKTHRAEIYRQGQDVEVLDNPSQLSGEDVLPGFVVNLQVVWE
jgi:Uma2 family endonuclease